jgi:hypothetical protein
VRVEPAPADHVATRGGEDHVAGAREERRGEQDGGADALAEFPVEVVTAHLGGMEAERVPPVQSAVAPACRMSWRRLSMSRMRGTFSSVTGWSVRSAAQTMGSAAFLLPVGRMVPASGRPPSTMNRGDVMVREYILDAARPA